MLNVLDRNGRETEGRSRSDEGFALPAVLFVTMMLSGLGIILLFTSGNERMAGRAVRESAKAFYAAEAGMNAVIGNWNQFAYDTLMPAAGDSLVQAWQTMENGCSYRSVIRRVDAGGDSVAKKMYSARVSGRGPGPLGGQRTLQVFVRTEPLMLKKAIITNGDLELHGHITIKGLCPGVHVNGNLLAGGGQHLVVIGDVTITGVNFFDPTAITDSLGNIVVPLVGVDSIPLPQMDPYDFCDEATHWLRNNWLVTVGPPADSVLLNNMGPPIQGWAWELQSVTKLVYTNDSGLTDGTWCAEGNIWIKGDHGSEANPVRATLIATKSIQMHGKPYLVAHHPKNVGLLAGGDLALHGDLSVITGVDGFVYAGSQCEFHGKTEIYAQIICYNGPQPANAKKWADANIIHGHANLNFGCGKLPYGYVARPLKQGGSWSQIIN